MEIINANTALLSNFEVLQEMKVYRSGKNSSGLKTLATITYETLQSLESFGAAKHQTAENIVNFIRAMQPYNLKREEILMMINDPPTAVLHVMVLVPFCDERLTEDQQWEIINLSKIYLLPAQPEMNGI